MKKIQLIWEFRGPDAEKTAEHHAIHLNEYVEKQDYPLKQVGSEAINDSYAVATMVIMEKDMLEFRDSLKPQRAIYWEE